VAEQLFPIHGHIPPLARLIKTLSFAKNIGLLLIDKGHHIVTDSQSHGNEPPHRPAYGKLGDVRVQLPDAVPCGVFSATLPPSHGEFCFRMSVIAFCSWNSIRNSGVMLFTDICSTRNESISCITLFKIVSRAQEFTHASSLSHPHFSASTTFRKRLTAFVFP
jgi:hypothetical protein